MNAPMFLQFHAAEIATVTVGLIFLAIMAASYMQAVNALSDLIKKENPGFWPGFYSFYFFLLIGQSRFEINISDPRYPEFVRRARRRMILLLLVFMAVVIAIGWFSRTPIGATPQRPFE